MLCISAALPRYGSQSSMKTIKDWCFTEPERLAGVSIPHIPIWGKGRERKDVKAELTTLLAQMEPARSSALPPWLGCAGWVVVCLVWALTQKSVRMDGSLCRWLQPKIGFLKKPRAIWYLKPDAESSGLSMSSPMIWRGSRQMRASPWWQLFISQPFSVRTWQPLTSLPTVCFVPLYQRLPQELRFVGWSMRARWPWPWLWAVVRAGCCVGSFIPRVSMAHQQLSQLWAHLLVPILCLFRTDKLKISEGACCFTSMQLSVLEEPWKSMQDMQTMREMHSPMDSEKGHEQSPISCAPGLWQLHADMIAMCILGETSKILLLF